MTAAGGIFRPGMRAYFIPFIAGLVLAASAFLPWVVVGGQSLAGVPDVWATVAERPPSKTMASRTIDRKAGRPLNLEWNMDCLILLVRRKYEARSVVDFKRAANFMEFRFRNQRKPLTSSVT